MTLAEAILAADLTRPNELEPELKRAWLSALDGQLDAELYAAHEDRPAPFTGYDGSEDPETAVLLVPVLWPIAQALGVNVIHFGMIVSIANVVGTMTPPVAVNIFSAASVTKLPMGKIVHGQWPFFIGYVGFFFLVVLFPGLSRFLL